MRAKGLMWLMVMGAACATTESIRESRREQLKSGERLLPRVPVSEPDGQELRFQIAELKLLIAKDRLEAGDREGADQARYEAGLLLDDLLEKAPGYARTPEVLTSRASVAILRERPDEAVIFLRRALERPGHSPENERYLRAQLPRALRLSGDCAGALALPVPEGWAGISTRFERAVCRRGTPELVCDELLAAVPGTDAPEPRVTHALRTELNQLAEADRAACVSRLPMPARTAISTPARP
jgi:hypothetical protein